MPDLRAARGACVRCRARRLDGAHGGAGGRTSPPTCTGSSRWPTRPSPPYPSWADAGYISIYPAAYVALVLLLRARAGRISPGLWLDGVICALGVAALVRRARHGRRRAHRRGARRRRDQPRLSPRRPRAARVRRRGLTVMGRRAGRTWWLVAAGFAVFAIVDAIYLYEVARDSYREWTILDSRLARDVPARGLRRMAARRRRSTGAGCAARACSRCPPVPRCWPSGSSSSTTTRARTRLAVWLASAALALIVVRFGLTLRENLRMLHASEQEAATDALTGLAQPPRARRGPRVGRGAPMCSRSSISTASSPTTTRSAIPPATRSWSVSGATWPSRSATPGAPTAWAATSSASWRPLREDDGALVMAAADALTERGRQLRHRVLLRDGRASSPATTRSRRCGSPTSASTRTSAAAVPATAESVHRVLMGVVGERDGELHEHVVGRRAARRARRARAGPGCRGPRARPPRRPPCTTSARSRSPTRSCTPRGP